MKNNKETKIQKFLKGDSSQLSYSSAQGRATLGIGYLHLCPPLHLGAIISDRKITSNEGPEFGIKEDGMDLLVADELIFDAEPNGARHRGSRGHCFDELR